MKTIIIYYSKYGFTKGCAEYLKENIKGDVDLFSINDFKEQNLNDYDNIIIGTAVYMGMINGKIKEFLNNNKDVLKDKKTSLFVCSGVKDNFELYLKQNLDEDIVNNLYYKDHFGGELKMEKLSFIDKMIAKMASKAHEGSEEPSLLKQNIDKFVDEINK